MTRTTEPDGKPLSDLRTELHELERRLRENLGAGGPFLRAEGLRLLDSGGKRLRPAMAIAAGRLGTYDRARVLPVAVAVELIHMATLVHDDVIDAAPLRRGAPTTFARHGAHTAVYTGDWLLVRALRSLSVLEEVLSIPDGNGGRRRSVVPEALVAGLEALCAGEVDQYLGRGRLPSVKTYLSRVERKTAALFSAACAAGAAASGQDDGVVRTCAAFGRSFGTAFQIRDDLLDVGDVPDGTYAGKPLSRDLRAGIATLPFLLAAKASPDYRVRLEDFFRRAGARETRPETVPSAADPLSAEVRRLTGEMADLGGIREARAVALRYENEAKERLSALPPSDGRDLLAALSVIPGTSRSDDTSRTGLPGAR